MLWGSCWAEGYEDLPSPPFLRPEFSDIVRRLIRRNQTCQIYVPTNSYFKDRMLKRIEAVLEEKDLELFVVEMSLDGLGEFHDKFRASPGSFKKAMEKYDALPELQRTDPRLRVHRGDPKDRLVVKLEDAHGQATEDGLELAAGLAKEAEARAAEQQVAPVRPH